MVSSTLNRRLGAVLLVLAAAGPAAADDELTRVAHHPSAPGSMVAGPAAAPGSAVAGPAADPATAIPTDASPAFRDAPGLDLAAVAASIARLGDPYTGIPPSHWGHPGFEDFAFVYDAAVAALILEAGGRHEDAVKLLDTFDRALHIPREQIRSFADSNRVYGMLKFFTPVRQGHEVVGIVNAIRRDSTNAQTEGRYEFWTTPGPSAWLLYAFVGVDPVRYAASIERVAELLRAMQAEDGGFRDGDRMRHTVHTEPHVDAAAALLMAMTRDPRAPVTAGPWPAPVEAAWDWFEQHALHLDGEQARIDQGVGPGGAQQRPATDAYTWTMAGPFGERISERYGIEALVRLSKTVLRHALVEVTWVGPDREARTSLLLDFTDPEHPDLQPPQVDDILHPEYGVTRGGYHPMGSPEWTAGAVLAFQKNAVRCERAWDASARTSRSARDAAIWFKALAIALEAEAAQTFARTGEILISPYATGQHLATGFGWRTPLFFVVSPKRGVLVRGGSPVGGWLALPMTGRNPFIPGDPYLATYRRIPSPASLAEARAVLRRELAHRPFTEPGATTIPLTASQINEPHVFVAKMWSAYNREGYEDAVQWAERVAIGEPTWVELAREENRRKLHDLKDLVAYPWGTTQERNIHPAHAVIAKYPLLNEVGAAMAGAVMAHYQLSRRAALRGDDAAATRHARAGHAWIRRMILEVPLHQIADTVEMPGEPPRIRGYWNGLVSWLHYSASIENGEAIGAWVRETLAALEAEGFIAGRDMHLPGSRQIAMPSVMAVTTPGEAPMRALDDAWQ